MTDQSQTTLREWLVIEDSRARSVFAPPEAQRPHGYIPRDVAERLLGRDLGGAAWFTRGDGDAMRAHPEWRLEFPPDTPLTPEEEAIMDADYETRVEAERDDWADQPLPEDAEIAAAHPMNSGRDDLYMEAMRLVGAKRSKDALVGLVTWLLLKAEVVDQHGR